MQMALRNGARGTGQHQRSFGIKLPWNVSPERTVLFVYMSFTATMIWPPLRGVNFENITIYVGLITVLVFKRLRTGFTSSRRLILRWINNDQADQGHHERKKVST
ncbi:hypothetical protein EVAR_93142_1 [Eumeta japonica]|uniref:Uncharacterized protein n=1 Tax=Eumeta variegata TaxID=151549 RepID=A0A4C1TF89_EUMVA|nr:hypothetical protein EVAR_93142_1 [Eumeta japonica]